MKLNIYNSVAELNENLINYVVEIAKKSIEKKGRFDFVLTGGNSPKELYRELGTTYKDKIDWTKVFFFFGDERYVLPNDKDYNGLMAKQNLFDPLDTNSDQIFYIDTTLPPGQSAVAYKKALDLHFRGKPIRFDLVLLGMGDDAHTASIFPETDLVKNEKKTVAAVWVKKLNTHRISLTAPLINNAENVAFITYGANKANALKHVIGDSEKNYSEYPAQLINPKSGNLDWFVDGEAAVLLNK